MKTNLFTWFALIVMLSLSACTNEELLSDVTTNKYEVDFGDTNVAESTLSVDEALNNMNFVYRNFDKEQQKERRIRTIELLKSSNLRPATRSGSAEDLPVAYVVNFDNESGYAILGADDRMPPIIMLGDEGSFSTDDYLEFLQNSQTRSGGEIDFNNPEEVQYAMVTNGLYISEPIPFPDPFQLPPRDTIMLAKVYPLVRTKWDQSAPYNHYCPEIEDTKAPAGCIPVAVGQILTSLTYHKNKLDWPNITGNETNTIYDIDWLTILKSSIDTASYWTLQETPGALATAYMLRAIGDHLEAEYKKTETAAYSTDVDDFFVFMGLRNVVPYQQYSTEDAYNMIVNNRTPMYMSARRVKNEVTGETSGHAFILDGWLQLGYTKDDYQSDGSLNGILEKIPIQYTFNLVHCNFGWDGTCDGYYTPGVFDLSETEFDQYGEENDYSDVTSSYYYNLNICEILYEI